MPKKSPYAINLSPDERKTLEKISRSYTSPYFEVVRAKVILFAAKNMDNKDIAERLDLPRQIVSKWRKRFFYERLPGLQDRARRGRPRDFSP